MENFKWLFDGLGSEIIILILGAIGGGTLGYKIGINKNSTKQSQKAGKNSKQIQNTNISYANEFADTEINTNVNKNKINQTQKAGKNSYQSQIGDV